MSEFQVGDRVKDISGIAGTISDSFPRRDATDGTQDQYVSYKALPVEWDNETRGYREPNHLEYAFDE
jgi:hypothetical protein